MFNRKIICRLSICAIFSICTFFTIFTIFTGCTYQSQKPLLNSSIVSVINRQLVSRLAVCSGKRCNPFLKCTLVSSVYKFLKNIVRIIINIGIIDVFIISPIIRQGFVAYNIIGCIFIASIEIFLGFAGCENKQKNHQTSKNNYN